MSSVWKTCVFIAFLFSGFVPSKLSAQKQILENRYSFNFVNVSYESVIDSMRQKAKCGFSYNPDFFPREKRYTARFINERLGTIIDSVLSPIQFYYKVVDNNIVILRKEIVANKDEKPYPQVSDSLKVIKLSGKVIDLKDHKPVEFTSVYIKDRNIGTMTNVDGNFTIKLPEKSLNDTVYFSCIGYKPIRKRVSEISKVNNTILLEVSAFQLKEVKVKPVDPKEVIKIALDRIPKNYSTKPMGLTSFYRETIQQNGDYVGLSEAVLNIYKASYSGSGNDQVSIYKGRRVVFEKQMDTVLFKFQGGIATSLMLDLAKNPSNFLSYEYFKYYEFTLDDIVTVEGRPTYVIGFDQDDFSPYALYKGKLYVDIEAYALVRAEFMISPKGLEKAADYLIQKSSRRLRVKPTFSAYMVNYTMMNNTWYLNYIREEVAFRVRKKYSFFGITFHSKAEMLITQTDSVNIHRIKLNKQVHSNDIFVEKLGKYDPDYWSEFNIIRPEESLEEALHKIKGKLERKNE